ncbi:unnamed protein product, partial [Orchesella dallaii]
MVVINNRNRNTAGQYSSLWVYKIETATLDVIQEISAELERKTICVCKKIIRELEDSDEYQILWDECSWYDLTTEFQNSTVSFSIPAGNEAGCQLNLQVSELTNYELTEFIMQYSTSEVSRRLDAYRDKYLETNHPPMNWYQLGLHVTPLHVAAKKRHYSIVKYILNLPNKNEIKEPKYIVHCCIAESINEDEYIIAQKLKIIELISTERKHWLDQQLRDKRTPLFCPNAHKLLLYQLVKLGADINSVGPAGCVLHSLAKYVKSSELYDEILVQLVKFGFNQFNCQDHSLKTALHVVLENFECLSSTIELFYKSKANLNLCDKYGNSVLFFAVQYRRPVSIIKTLELFGSDLRHKNLENENVLHTCVKLENYDGLAHFLQSSKIGKKEVTAENIQNETPFIQGLRYGNGMNINLINMMIKKGLVINKVLSSVALKCLILNTNIVNPKATKNFIQIGDFLLQQGGIMTYLTRQAGAFRSPWELLKVYKNLHEFSKITQCNQMLLEQLHKRGVVQKKEL